mmetsp:Transcript_5137/g.18669  ORF Transcript_5137/g.18669 Transcript_5137/m.18669 type:complete len:207 (+) Transcript_5137:167-787(+)
MIHASWRRASCSIRMHVVSSRVSCSMATRMTSSNPSMASTPCTTFVDVSFAASINTLMSSSIPVSFARTCEATRAASLPSPDVKVFAMLSMRSSTAVVSSAKPLHTKSSLSSSNPSSRVARIAACLEESGIDVLVPLIMMASVSDVCRALASKRSIKDVRTSAERFPRSSLQSSTSSCTATNVADAPLAEGDTGSYAAPERIDSMR